MYLYVAETSQDEKADVKIEVKKEITKEITKDELGQLNSAFFMCGIYHSIKQIECIVVENGEDFKQYMSEQNLLFMRNSGVSSERIIMLANKYVLNYASAIKTYIDMEKRLLKKHKTEEDVKAFEEMCRSFYDKHIEYRFWVNFRNYIVHCEFPYSIYKEELNGGCKVICTKERLLRFDNWKHSKADILEMDEAIDLTKLIDDMNGMIYALYMDFFRGVHKEIMEGIQIYGDFCRKYNVQSPIILKTKERNKMEGARMQPLPIKELRACFGILKSHPHVDFKIKE